MVCPQVWLYFCLNKAKRIFGIQCSKEKDLKKDVCKLVEEIVNPKVPSHSPSLPDQPQNARDWGLKHEDSARRAYYKVESKHHHKLTLESKGLYYIIFILYYIAQRV